jgi:anti-sigma factor RsiW
MTESCSHIAEELVAYADGEHSDAERARVEAHVGSCLACRRELERVHKLSDLLAGLPSVEPSPGFEQRFWARLAAAPTVARPRWRAARIGLPALAAAAALALVSYWTVARVERAAPPDTRAVAAAPSVAAPPAALARSEERRHDEGTDDEVRVARSELETLPPELVEHPELFLRYPVVRRLRKLEHFEEVRRFGGAGSDASPLG